MFRFVITVFLGALGIIPYRLPVLWYGIVGIGIPPPYSEPWTDPEPPNGMKGSVGRPNCDGVAP